MVLESAKSYISRFYKAILEWMLTEQFFSCDFYCQWLCISLDCGSITLLQIFHCQLFLAVFRASGMHAVECFSFYVRPFWPHTTSSRLFAPGDRFSGIQCYVSLSWGMQECLAYTAWGTEFKWIEWCSECKNVFNALVWFLIVCVITLIILVGCVFNPSLLCKHKHRLEYLVTVLLLSD